MASTAKIRVKLKGYDSVVVDKSARSIIETAISTGAKVAGPIPMPTRKRKIAVNRSPFIYKSSIEHFEINTHKRVIDIIDPTPKTIDALQHLQMPAGVGVEIQ
ncbi:MAG: 30S ribosomal protein S10, small subunit ribosomal protein S10 [candidate division WS6 bacterium GW2011_GWC1_36_11]|jgi:small subunit ribosomal protein S10|uniref:Small ribosomal subunit protein uS10 n=3 Tax=Candidatus Dojkabacteria TaxID=74243 RepID=A0A0G0DIC3_9BACT|nr:MAG: 30S ribosomal protein S10, small subunit ribosomal protein S10 [candidate division WS6 bacterium GW2011_GWC1_36_11]KKQ04264.1 MAG: 30S ribosomal protein S10 [candidate division WS6 bacterium GW2011_WS6_36_26]KKQ11157.1 MAG: 30S ribosomal protein S10 [candidate division WS6 bacterium GW2011_GWE1_36_69]KKQ11617.1 MAG: 30S ribosomal protein S10 [candidate division WS6 bacterium GW2011_GWC2_36_7]KKQ16235.1 MAG: 30S ribosomal protein S10 [candidate division WS6 bacterium GW2011_GWF1_36_8]MB